MYVYIYILYFIIYIHIYECHCYVIVISFLLFCFYHWWSQSICWLTLLCPKSKPQRTPTPQKQKRTASESTQLKSYTFRWSYTLTKTQSTTIMKVILSSIFHLPFSPPKTNKSTFVSNKITKILQAKLKANQHHIFFPKKSHPTTTAWKNTSSQV